MFNSFQFAWKCICIDTQVTEMFGFGCAQMKITKQREFENHFAWKINVDYTELLVSNSLRILLQGVQRFNKLSGNYIRVFFCFKDVLTHDKLLSTCNSAEFSKDSKEVQYTHISLILPSCYSLKKSSVGTFPRR